MSAQRALIFCLLSLGISIGGLMFMAVSARAEAPSCITTDSLIDQAKKMGIAQSEILLVDDIEFINDYTKAIGLGIPDDSSPKQILLVTFVTKAYVGLVEQDGCVRYQAAIPSKLHIEALKAATSGV